MNKQISQAAIAFVFLISGLALLSCLVTIASLQSNVLNGSLAMPPNPVLWVLISGMALRLIETEYKSDRQRVEADLRHTQADLEQRVLERTAELNQLTERLQQELQDRQSIEQALQASEELFRTLIRDLNVGVVIQSAQTEILLSNPKALELLSLTEDQLLGKTSFDPDWQVIREDGSVFPSALHPVPQAIATRSAVRNVVMGICSPKSSDQSVLEAGEPIWLLVNAEPQFTPVGEIRQVICTFSDITERKRILEKLRSRAQLERDLHGVVQAIRHSLDLEQVFVTATHEVARLLQADRAEIVQYFSDRQIWRNVADHRHIPNLPNRLGKEITDFERAVDAQLKRLEIVRFDTLQPMSESTNLGQTELVQRFTSSHCTGAWLLIPLMTEGSLWGCLSLNRNCDRPTWQDAEVDLAMVVADQVAVAIQQSELYQKLQIANQELQHLAKLDGLTQIGNRRCFNDYLTQEWLRMAREQGPISLILCDVDYFKLYNDTYGHLAGDTCLIQIARAIGRAVKRPADLATRYGGEEFAVILPNTDIQGALQVAQAIRNEVQRLGLRHDASPVKERVTLSLGIASAFPTPHSRFEELLDASDRALYCAKASGRDRFHFHNLTELQEA